MVCVKVKNYPTYILYWKFFLFGLLSQNGCQGNIPQVRLTSFASKAAQINFLKAIKDQSLLIALEKVLNKKTFSG